MLPFLPIAASAAASWFARGSAKDAEAAEKLDLVKELAGLTPAQAKAVDAIKTQSLEEMRTRAELNIGPFGPLPPNANARAQEARERRIASLSTKNVGTKLVSADEVKAVIDQKVHEANQNRLAGLW